MRRLAVISSIRVNRAAILVGDVHMTSKRPERDFEGAGVNISLAIAGVVAAGLGLVTMNTAFRPLPQPGVPVVISHSVAAPTPATWRHAPDARPAAHHVSVRTVDDEEAIAPVRHHLHPAVAAASGELAPAPAPPPEIVAAKAAASVPAPKPPVQTLAKADLPAEKLCKAPTPQVLSAKALQPAMILRYDSRFKAPTPDIQPQRPVTEDEQRRLKLSALLGRVLEN